jgi:hypothetical protein
MASSLVATGVQFPDNSIQTTAAVATPSVIPAGTVMLFAQTAAPTGFTKNTSTGNNTALRLVTGTASTGGSVAFTTAFASQTPSGTVSVSGSVGNHTLSTAQLASHTHTWGGSGCGPDGGPAQGANPQNRSVTGSTGGNNAHNHSLSISSSTFSGNAINLAVSYVDVIRATKD